MISTLFPSIKDNESLNEWMGEWMNEWVNECNSVSICNFSTWDLVKKFWVRKTISQLYSELESSLGDVGVGPYVKKERKRERESLNKEEEVQRIYGPEKEVH